MFDSLRVRASQGAQYITDLRKAVPNGFRGRPQISSAPCKDGCDECVKACPTGAIVESRIGPAASRIALDLGKCVFCAECVEACPEEKITFTTQTRMSSSTRGGLVVTEGPPRTDAVSVSKSLKAVFGRSLRLRQVSAGGCNGCEQELNAVANVNFDLQRFGIEWVASPRHADALVLSGPITRAMADAVRLSWDAMPDPRFVVAFGACAISGGLYAGAPAVDRTFLDEVGPTLFVPGCPPHPLTFVNAVLDLLGIA